jgi:hypothetical protein
MNLFLKRTAQRALTLPFVAGLVVGIGATGAGAAILGSSVFPDVQPGSYYDVAVGELNAAGIIRGSNGKFMPEKPVTRAEVATMLYRLRAELRGEATVEPSSSTPSDPQPSSTTPTSRARSSSKASSVSSSSMASSSASSYNPKGVFRFTTTAFTVNEQLGKVTIGVVRTGGNEGTAAVNYAITQGTATAGSDFTTASGTILLSNKETSKTFTILINDDSLSEGNETFTVTLSNPQYGVGLASPGTASVTILDNETSSTSSQSSTASTASSVAGPAAGTFNFAAAAYAVREEGGAATLTVTRTGGSQGTATVAYATQNGTATGNEYTGANGTLTFNAGETSKTFTITPDNNTSITGNKAFTATLSAPTGGAALGDARLVTVTIFDDESGSYGSGSLKFSKANYDVTVSQGKAVITVMRTGGADGTITVNYYVSNGSAIAGSDARQISR